MTIPFVLCALMLAQTPVAQTPAPGRPLPQTAARDAAKKPDGAKIRGRVTAADTGRPIRKATIRIAAEPPIPGGPAMVVTDNEGRFEAADLPAGDYTLTASSPGYVSSTYGQRRVDEPGKPIEVAANVTVERVNFALYRGGVITGAVSDEFGDWVVNSTVRAMRVEFQKGKRELVQAGGNSGITNDIGEFRLFGLAAGEYYVSVTARVPFGQVRQSDSAFPPTFYPGTANVAEAQAVKVVLGQISNIAIAMTSSRAAKVRGFVLDADGQPMRYAFLNLTSRTGASRLGVSAGQVNADGSFTLSAVPPGDYQLMADSTSRPADGRPQSALTTITVTGDDMDDVRLIGTRWVSGAGRFVVEPERRASLKSSTLRVGVLRTAQDDPFIGIGGGSTKDDGTFSFNAPAGAVSLTVAGLPAGWRVKAVRLNSLDVADTGFNLPAGDTVEGIEVELTNRGPHVSGRVTDARGDPVKQYSVVIFPQEREKRSWNSRYLATARPDNDSQFRIASLPPGDYYAIALETLATGQGSDPEFLQKWEVDAVKFSIGESETKALALKLSFP